ncbi:MAG: SDR family NAD(P)-dependent oxidoreductase [Gammaproteobacteria bacterium]|uniref:SDR family NAD(P)-dependent oxidoreductase n=1 Tax=Bradyrhizobium sp. TaxID=376 RepID=UPI003D0D9D07
MIAAVIEAAGGDAFALPVDIREPATVTAALEQIRAAWGRLDVLVNNAAARDITVKGFEAVVRNNLVGTCASYGWSPMLEHGGRIVCVTAAMRSGMGGFSHTAAARGGAVALTKSLAFERAAHGILINCVAPGTIKTDAMGQYPIPPDTGTGSIATCSAA